MQPLKSLTRHSLGGITRHKKSSMFFNLEKNSFCPCNLSHIMMLHFYNNLPMLSIKKTLRNLLFSIVDNIEKFFYKHNLFIFHVLFAIKAFVQDNEISLGWIVSTEKNSLSWNI